MIYNVNYEKKNVEHFDEFCQNKFCKLELKIHIKNNRPLYVYL